jgi:hypothetical protein
MRMGMTIGLFKKDYHKHYIFVDQNLKILLRALLKEGA